MIKVALLKSRASHRGGLEKYTSYLASAFAKKKCEVILLTTGIPPQIEGIKTISLCEDSKLTFYQLLRFDRLAQKWLKKNPHEVIFGMERTTYQTHYRAGNGVHARYLQQRKLTDSKFKQLSFSINPLHRLLLSMEKKAFEHPELKVLFTNSNMVREEILQRYATPPEKLQVVHNGVEWEACSKDFEASFPLSEGKPFHFLFVGNGYRRKGLPFLLKGLAQLSKENFFLNVIGKDRDIKFFERWTERLKLKDKIAFLGARSDIRSFYQKADALVIPSIYDPFSNVTVEALAMGLYVVSSRFNGGYEILNETTGTVIEELSSAESMAQALKKALSRPKTEKRARIIRQSIKELDFSNQLDKIVQKTLQTV